MSVAIFLSPLFLASLIKDAESSSRQVAAAAAAEEEGADFKRHGNHITKRHDLYSAGSLLDSVDDFRTQLAFFRNKLLFRTIFI